MSDPRRWILDGAGSSRDERNLLRAAAAEDIDPPSGAKAKVWAALVMQIGPGGGGGGASPPSADPSGAGPGPAANAGASAAGGGAASVGATAAGGGVVKTVLIGAASVGVAIAAYFAFAPSEPDSIAGSTAPAMTAAQSAHISPPSFEDQAAPTPARPADVDEPTASAPPLKPLSSADRPSVEPRGGQASGLRPASHKSHGHAPPSSPPAADEGASQPVASPPAASDSASQPVASGAPADRASRLREESQLLSEARDALRRGDPTAALRKLDEAATRFSSGVLVQEREALTIEALYKGGQRAAAADRAASFLRAYPLSPHATRVQQFAR